MKTVLKNINQKNCRHTFSAALLLLLLFTTHYLKAQTVSSEYKVKAIFIYNFTRFIEWPRDSYASRDAPFKIAILGNDPFNNYLQEAIANERVDGRVIIIERYNSVKEIENCNILFINLSESDKIKQAIAAAKDKKILTISEHPDFVQWGGIIRIFSDNNKIRMQINDNAARKEKIKISAKLLNVAEVYYP